MHSEVVHPSTGEELGIQISVPFLFLFLGWTFRTVFQFLAHSLFDIPALYLVPFIPGNSWLSLFFPRFIYWTLVMRSRSNFSVENLILYFWEDLSCQPRHPEIPGSSPCQTHFSSGKLITPCGIRTHDPLI